MPATRPGLPAIHSDAASSAIQTCLRVCVTAQAFPPCAVHVGVRNLEEVPKELVIDVMMKLHFLRFDKSS
jgi:hypothetical protein